MIAITICVLDEEMYLSVLYIRNNGSNFLDRCISILVSYLDGSELREI